MHKKSFSSLAFDRLAFGSFLSAAIAPLVLAAPVRADALNWIYNPTTHQLEITVSGGTPRYFLAAEPARIVLDLPNTEVDPIATQQTYSTGAIRQIRIAQFQPGQARLVMELAPGTVLAPGQVELRRVNGDRWVLRPLLIGETATTTEPSRTSITALTSSPETRPTPSAVAPIPRTIATPSMVFPGAIAPLTSAPPTPASASLPPLEPGALAIPVEAPPAQSPSAPVSPAPASAGAIALSVPPAVSALPNPSSPDRQSIASPTPLPTANLPTANLPADLPPATQPRDRAAVAIRVPAIAPTAAPLPSPIAPVSNASLSNPVLPTPEAASPVALSVLPPAANNVIEFGQPLVGLATPERLIPAGTVLNLRYAGREPIALSDAQQEVLLLNEAVRDRSGNIIVPANSEVIGRFETSDAGSQFIAQSVNWQDQTLLLNAESEVLRGDRRLLGLLGGIRLRQIQPNQAIKVRLLQDLMR